MTGCETANFVTFKELFPTLILFGYMLFGFGWVLPDRMSLKLKILVLSVTFFVGGWWMFRLNGQDCLLRHARAIAMAIPQSIDVGDLGITMSSLQEVDQLATILRSEFAALPYIRKGEQEISRSIPTLRVSCIQRSVLTASVARSLLDFARQGKMEDAQKTLQAANKDLNSADENYKALEEYISRLKAQDFEGVEKATKKVSDRLAQNLLEDQIKQDLIGEFEKVYEKEKKENYAIHAKIASEVKSLISLSSPRKSGDFKPTLKGKALIWDATKREVATAYQLLPDNLRASYRDTKVTIFSIMRREQIEVGYYSESHQPAYKEKILIGVVYWPEKKSAGTLLTIGASSLQAELR